MLLRLILPSLRRNLGRAAAIMLQFLIGSAVAAAALSLAFQQELLQGRIADRWQHLREEMVAGVAGDRPAPPGVAVMRRVVGQWRKALREERLQHSTYAGPDSLAPWELPYGMINQRYAEIARPAIAEGRWFRPEDWEGSGPVPVVLTQAAARRIAPGQSALGARIGVKDQLVVVGVLRQGEPLLVRGNPQLFSMFTMTEPIVLLPDAALQNLRKTDLLEWHGEGEAVWVGPVPPDAQEVGLAISLAEAFRFSSQFYGTTRNALLLIAGFVVGVAALGFVGVALTSLEQRRREMGLRVALGATPAALGGQVLTEVMVVTLLGSGPGSLLGCWLATRLEGGPPVYLWEAAGLVVLGALLLGLLVGLVPGLVARRLNVEEALRSG